MNEVPMISFGRVAATLVVCSAVGLVLAVGCSDSIIRFVSVPGYCINGQTGFP